MGPVKFFLKKWLLGEDFLQQFSCSLKDLHAELAGKTVAIVGNARSLSTQEFGHAINHADIVIRMHAAPLVSAKSHGSRTDWLALAMPVPEDVIESRAPSRLLWMAKKRKRLRWRFVRRSGFYLHAVDQWQQAYDQLSAPPTTGLMLIDLVAGSEAQTINLYGFDFFASLSLSGRRTAKQVPHDFAAEKEFVESLIKGDLRVTLNH